MFLVGLLVLRVGYIVRATTRTNAHTARAALSRRLGVYIYDAWSRYQVPGRAVSDLQKPPWRPAAAASPAQLSSKTAPADKPTRVIIRKWPASTHYGHIQ